MFHAINESYYKKADCILLVYDITRKDTFDSLERYFIPKIKELCKENYNAILLGNKADRQDRKVPEKKGIALALKYNLEFKESSCYENKNVSSAFEALVEGWNMRNKTKEREEKVIYSKTKNVKNKSSPLKEDNFKLRSKSKEIKNGKNKKKFC